MFTLNKENLRQLVAQNDLNQTFAVLNGIDQAELNDIQKQNIFSHIIECAIELRCLKPIQALLGSFNEESEMFKAVQIQVSNSIARTNNLDLVEKCLLSQLISVNSILESSCEKQNKELLDFILNHEYIAVLPKNIETLQLGVYQSNSRDMIEHVESILGCKDHKFSEKEIQTIMNNCFMRQSKESIEYLVENHDFDIKSFLSGSVGETELNNIVFSLAFATSVNTFFTEKSTQQVEFLEYLVKEGADSKMLFQMYFKSLMNEENPELFKEVYSGLVQKGVLTEDTLKELVNEKKLQSFIDYTNSVNEKSQLDEQMGVSLENKNKMKL